jgi:hypothetical protein
MLVYPTRVLLGSLKKCFYGTRRFITVFIKVLIQSQLNPRCAFYKISSNIITPSYALALINQILYTVAFLLCVLRVQHISTL